MPNWKTHIEIGKKVNKVVSDCTDLFSDNLNIILRILRDGKSE